MKIIWIGVLLIVSNLHEHAMDMQSWAIIDNKAVNISKVSCRLKFGLLSFNEKTSQCCLAQGLYEG